MSSRRLLWLPAVLFTLALLAAACGGDDTADTTTSTETTASDATTSTDSSDDSSDDDSDDSGSDESSDDEAALEAAADELVVVCADQDRDRLRDLSGDGTKDRVRDRDPLFSVVDDLSVVDRVVSIDGDTATVTVTLRSPSMGRRPRWIGSGATGRSMGPGFWPTFRTVCSPSNGARCLGRSPDVVPSPTGDRHQPEAQWLSTVRSSRQPAALVR